MGTETHYPIGTVLTRRDPQDDALDEIRVVGGGKKLVITSNTEFGESFEMDSAVARRDYESDLPGELYTAGRPTYVEPGLSPEQAFAEMERNAAPVEPEDPVEAVVIKEEPTTRTRRRKPNEE